MKKIVCVVLGTTVADMLTKWWAHTQMPNISLIGDWLRIMLFKNTGIAFSTPLPGIHIIIPLILGGLLIFMIKSWKNISEKENIGYAMIFTGGLLNALERALFGSVTDMISVRYFAVFNIADIAVTSGVILLLISSFLSRKKNILDSNIKRN